MVTTMVSKWRKMDFVHPQYGIQRRCQNTLRPVLAQGATLGTPPREQARLLCKPGCEKGILWVDLKPWVMFPL